VIDKYDNLTDTSDIASLPAGLFSTPVKLSVPFLLNFLSPLRVLIIYLYSDIASLPAGLFSTPVKLSVSFILDEGNHLNEFPFIVFGTRWGQSNMNFLSPSVLYLAYKYEAGAISDT
jgi:hypothetical protein